MENDTYQQKQKEQFTQYESLCKRCGACCGAFDGDPCVNLIKDKEGRCFCKEYDSRLGPQRTASGKVFNCVMIRDNISKYGFYYPGCGYNLKEQVK